MRQQRLWTFVLAIVTAWSFSTAPSAQTPEKSGAAAVKWLRADHVAIRVANFNESLAWYRDKLGFAVVKQWKGPPTLAGGLDFAYLEANGVVLEIIGGGMPARHAAPPASLADLVHPIGWNHLCLRVEDMSVALATLKGLGVEAYAATHNPVLNRLIVQIRDNSGIPIELVQYLDK
jgi:catechol 2,3-dioxygenase-like lactoylglutathione lyase family enzyme